MQDTPFILSKRKTSPFWQVRFRNPETSSCKKYINEKSTKETVKPKAIADDGKSVPALCNCCVKRGIFLIFASLV